MRSCHVFFGLPLTCILFSKITIAQSNTLPTAIVTAPPTSTPSTTVPSCAISCIQAAVDAQECVETNTKCLCQKSSIIQAAISTCLAASSTCSDSEKASAIASYPKTCALLGYSTKSVSTISASIVTASGVAPTKISHGTALSLVLTATGGSTFETTIAEYNQNDHHVLGLPAILGIILAVSLLVIGIAAVLVWAYLRRRQQVQRQRRMDGDTEFAAPVGKPNRSRLVRSRFVVQPPPVEKDCPEKFGDPLSRSSTLVAPPLAVVTGLNKALPEIKISALDDDHSMTTPQEQERTKRKTHNSQDGKGDHTRSSRSTLDLIVESLGMNKHDGYDTSNRI